jgi:thiosulfate dehydrogenase [quinone] large subunit
MSIVIYEEKFSGISLAVFRLAMGWVMLYAGITKVLDPGWSAEGYLKGAKTFTGFYQLLASPGILPVINFVNEWALTLLGISLILGVFVRISSILGAVLMLLYYFPVLDFPYVGMHGFIIDEHIIYALGLLLFAALGAGKQWSFANWCAKLPICRRYSTLHNLLSQL